MLYANYSCLKIISVPINNINYKELINVIDSAIHLKNKLLITGANVHISNLSIKDPEFNGCLKNFQIIHPDGIGIYLASRFLFGRNGFKERTTGSDFYSYLIDFCIKKDIFFFFFGDKEITLNKIHITFPNLKIVGYHNGFCFDDEEVIKKINSSNADILIVGLGSGKQEKWISEHYQNIKASVVVAVGDGIKVFAGNKKRGPKILQMLGLEWFVRFIFDPKRLWKRYIIGIPWFIFRVIKFKFMNTKTG